MEALVARKPKTETWNMRMSADVKAKAAHIADSRYMSLAALVEGLLRREIEAFEKANGAIVLPEPPAQD